MSVSCKKHRAERIIIRCEKYIQAVIFGVLVHFGKCVQKQALSRSLLQGGSGMVLTSRLVRARVQEPVGFRKRPLIVIAPNIFRLDGIEVYIKALDVLIDNLSSRSDYDEVLWHDLMHGFRIDVNRVQLRDFAVEQTMAFHEPLAGIDIDLHGNRNVTHKISNDLFDGELMLLLRESPLCDYCFGGETDVIWELQIQGRFVRRPTGPLYLALEVPQEEQYNANIALKAIINACIRFIKSWGYEGIHLSYGGEGEYPHIALPAFQAFGKVVVTRKFESPPKLGTPIPEAVDFQHKRKRSEWDHTIDPECIYTLSFNNTYFSPLKWCFNGIPLIGRLDLSRFCDKIRISIYELKYQTQKETPSVCSTQGCIRAVAAGRHVKREHMVWCELQVLK